MLQLVPKLATLALTLAIGLNLVSCSKQSTGDTTFAKAKKGFEKQLTSGQ